MAARGRPPSWELERFAGAVGAAWRRCRRGPPSDVQVAAYDLMMELRKFLVPTAGVSVADSISQARADLRRLVPLLVPLAVRRDQQRDRGTARVTTDAGEVQQVGSGREERESSKAEGDDTKALGAAARVEETQTRR